MLEKKKIVIVGSGIGGLVCGAMLSKEGYHVTVLEMNKQIGGNLQSFVRDRVIFDSGVHYVGGLQKGQNLYKIFQYFGILDKLKLQKLNEDAFDKILFHNDEKEYCYAQGYPKFIESLVKDFPNERMAIEKYCKTIQTVCEKFPLYNLKEGDFFEKSSYLEIDTKTFIESLTTNKKLQNVLGGNNPLYAGSADKTPLYVHALVLNSYIESSWKVLDGGSQIAKLLTRIILNHGGNVKNRTKVNKFIVKEGLAQCVETTDGKQYFGDYFISNIHPAKTLEMAQTDSIRPAYRNRITQLQNSTSGFIAYLTFKPKTIKYEKTNYYCYLKDDVWTVMDHNDSNWPLFYAIFFSGSSKSGEFAEGMTIMAYMRFDEVEKWKHSANTVGNPDDRGEEYEAFKKGKAERLIDVVSEKFPGLKEAINTCYTSTPLTFRDYMGTDDGSIYGIVKDYRDPLRTFISPRTKIENLLLTGQNINLHGVLGVTISSLVTCSVLLGMKNILNKIEDAQN